MSAVCSPAVRRERRTAVRSFGLAVAASMLLDPGSALAASPPRIQQGIPGVTPDLTLPSAQARAQRAGRSVASRETWNLGVEGDPRELRAVAAGAGGAYDARLGVLTVPAGAAREVTDRMGARVRWAGPDPVARAAATVDDPAVAAGGAWSRALSGAPLDPAPGALAPIGIVDDSVDTSVAELAGVTPVQVQPVKDPHGTMVASVASAPLDGTGVVGVAPGAPTLSWGTTLLCSDVARGVAQLVDRGARVINLSLEFIYRGPADRCDPLYVAISYAYAKGTTVIAASGNEGYPDNPTILPAVYPHVVTVGAIDRDLRVARFSSYGDAVDLAAPGVDVPVDIPTRFDTADGTVDGRTAVSGTSFASPHVAGIASWIVGARPDLDPGQVAHLLRSSAADLGPAGWDPFTGSGLADVQRALAAPTPKPDLLEPNDIPSFVPSTRADRTFGKRTVWSGGKAATLRAWGDSADDAFDAYRVRVPAGARLRASLAPGSSDADLYAFSSSVRSFVGVRPLAGSARRGKRTDVFRWRNRSRSARTILVVVRTVPDGGRRASTRYTLRLRRG